MFKLRDHVPEVYIENSRDFQLFCNSYDSIQGQSKFLIDSLSRVSSSSQCMSHFLPLISDKLGFFINTQTSDDELRFILSAFPTIIRHKGTIRGVKYVAILFQRFFNNSEMLPEISVDQDAQMIRVNFKATFTGTKLLESLFKYVTPIGYLIEYTTSTPTAPTDVYYYSDRVLLDYTNNPNADVEMLALRDTVGHTSLVHSIEEE